MTTRLNKLLVYLVLLGWLAGCNMPTRLGGTEVEGGEISDLPIAEPLPALNMTVINFQVEVPTDTPDEEVFLSVLDEVTGLALNPTYFSMQGIPAPAPGEKKTYSVSLPVTMGTVIKYRYERQTSEGRVSEHLSDGQQVRYRIYTASGPGTVKDIVSRWTDTSYQEPSGRITGKAVDAATGDPLPNILVAAGGDQVITSADGSFRIDGLPEGVHNLVAYSIDGAYQPFQQGALVAPESSTEALLQLESAQFVKGIFVVRVPENTPPIVPIRMAGNLHQLGNTFATLTGGVSSLVSALPQLTLLPDDRYMLTLSLPVGADIRYKYTLGDGFWNAEHNPDGSFKLRQVVVPGRDFLLEEEVATWFSSSTDSITFDVTVPAETPANEIVSIQLNPLFGWTEPIPIWKLDATRWAYVLYSPLNLPGNLSYRFCRNNQCGTADDILTPGQYGQGRPVEFMGGAQTISVQVTEWLNLPWSTNPYPIFESVIAPRNDEYWMGFEHLAAFQPSWISVMPASMEKISLSQANWLVLSPTWTFDQGNPGSSYPLLDALPGQDMLEPELGAVISMARLQNLKIALFPGANFPLPPDEWWTAAARDETWWSVWFEQLSRYILNQAVIAAQQNVSALIIGGEWIEPSLPEGKLADGSPSNSPANAVTLWTGLLAEVRQQFPGKVLWALPFSNAASPPSFIDSVDGIYLMYTSTPEINQAGLEGADLSAEFGQQLDNTALTLQILENKPIVLAFSSPAEPDPQGQYKSYQAMLAAVNARDWITGFSSRGFYPPVPLNDTTDSAYGKPVMDLLSYWYNAWSGGGS